MNGYLNRCFDYVYHPTVAVRRFQCAALLPRETSAVLKWVLEEEFHMEKSPGSGFTVPQLRVSKVRPAALLMHWLAVASLLLAPAVSQSWIRWLAVGALLVQGLGNLGIRTLFRRNMAALPRLDTPPDNGGLAPRPGVTFIIPARDEEECIEQAARSMLMQDYERVEFIAINDGSSDNTPGILDTLAREFPKLRVIHDPPVAPGWRGKANAIWTGAQHANPDHEWLFLTDADAVFEPDVLHAAVAIASRNKLDLLTGIVYLQNGSIWEELVMPAKWSGIVVSANPARLNDPASAPVGVGPFMLVRRSAYLDSGGHAAFPGREPEDTLLAAVIKAWGGKVGVAVVDRKVRVRIYNGYHAMRDAFVRKARIVAGDNSLVLQMRTAYTLLQEVLPMPVAVFAAVTLASSGWNASWAAILLAGAWAYGTYSIAAKEFRRVARMRRGLEWCHPVAGCIRARFMIEAWWQCLRRSPMHWRGRPVSVDANTPEP
ncbi:MAG: glycosyltransferase [Candidatus Hydrogenedentes bacterium]|nr:glycosyltransferase [Candidatus Hydrogenedentota bacterium]